jgi:hypothetical protein
LAKQATFHKPAKNRHMRPLYLRFKFQRLQWFNDGRIRRFAYDSS